MLRKIGEEDQEDVIAEEAGVPTGQSATSCLLTERPGFEQLAFVRDLVETCQASLIVVLMISSTTGQSKNWAKIINIF